MNLTTDRRREEEGKGITEGLRVSFRVECPLDKQSAGLTKGSKQDTEQGVVFPSQERCINKMRPEGVRAPGLFI